MTARSTDQRAVSEFTGVAILIAFTVIVTATVGVYVLVGAGEDNAGPPEANFTFQYFDTSSSLLVRFQTGENITAGNISFRSKRTENRATWAALAVANKSTLIGPGNAVQLSKRNAWGEPINLESRIAIYYTGGNESVKLAEWSGP